MIGLALVAALVAPRWEIGAGVGGAVVQDEPLLTLGPWAGLQQGALAAAVQAPLRLDLGSGGLRTRDWDEPADLGRVVRFVRYGQGAAGAEGLRVGQLADVTLGQGTLVSRYHNEIDEDHARVGARATYRTGALGLDVFSDQLLGSPVAGGRLEWRLLDWLSLAGTAAADFEFPTKLLGTVDEVANLRARTRIFAGYGASVGVALPTLGAVAPTLYGAVNRLDDSELGAHLGARLDLERPGWRASLRGEAAHLGARYDGAWFDAGYLIDRWRGKATLREGLDAVWGARGEIEVQYAQALRVGVDYSDAAQAGRAGLTTWVQVPTNALQIGAWYRNRYPADRAGLLDPDESLAAVAVTVHLDAWWWLNVTVARVWRVDEAAAAYRPFSEVGLSLEGLFGPG